MPRIRSALGFAIRRDLTLPGERCHAGSVASLARSSSMWSSARSSRSASVRWSSSPRSVECERLVESHVAAFEPRDELVELALQLLERLLVAHGRTSSTRAPSSPRASSTSMRVPSWTTFASRRTPSPARTIA